MSNPTKPGMSGGPVLDEQGVALYAQGEHQQGQKLAQEALRRDPRYQNIEFLKQNLWGDRLLIDTKKFLQYLQYKS